MVENIVGNILGSQKDPVHEILAVDTRKKNRNKEMNAMRLKPKNCAKHLEIVSRENYNLKR